MPKRSISVYKTMTRGRVLGLSATTLAVGEETKSYVLSSILESACGPCFKVS